MSYDDPNLVYIPDEIKRLTQEASDAEWNNDPRMIDLIRELNYYKDQLEKGNLYEPNF